MTLHINTLYATKGPHTGLLITTEAAAALGRKDLTGPVFITGDDERLSIANIKLFLQAFPAQMVEQNRLKLPVHQLTPEEQRAKQQFKIIVSQTGIKFVQPVSKT